MTESDDLLDAIKMFFILSPKLESESFNKTNCSFAYLIFFDIVGVYYITYKYRKIKGACAPF